MGGRTLALNPPRPTATLRAWRGLSRLLSPLLLGWLWWRGRREPAYREHLRERLGFIPVEPGRHGGLWLHAASVGEVQAARPLIEALLRDWPEHTLTVSTQTPTGAAALRAAWGERIAHRYAPLDTPGAVGRFLDRLRPQALVLIERELWPQWLFACAMRALPVLLVNARLTESSAAGYRRWPALMAHAWPRLQVAAADTASAERLQALGVPAAQLRTVGNLKFDAPAAASSAALPDGLQQRTLVVAGSTHAGDEAHWLAAWPAIIARHPGALLVLVPRHPQRFDEVAATLERQGWRFQRRSDGAAVAPDTQVLLVDAMGELMAWYQAAAVCFVGGTLAPVGGHNPLEPLSLGQPVLFGPHTHNAAALFDETLQRGAGVRVGDALAMQQAVLDALAEPRTWQARAEAARALIDANRGASERTLAQLSDLLGPVDPHALGAVLSNSLGDGSTRWRAASVPAGLNPGGTAVEHLATGSGRGQAALVELPDGTRAVLRHYRRGGLVARLSQDRFASEPLPDTRAMAEFSLLRLMRAWGLPVPAPLAAWHHPRGPGYRADIAVAWLPGTRNLVQILRDARPAPGQWRALGQAIRRLHDRQVHHADLNAHNLLLDEQGQAWIVDFDKCALRPGDRWKTENLARLLRSLRKEATRQARFHWDEADWALLLAGYDSGHDAPARVAPFASS